MVVGTLFVVYRYMSTCSEGREGVLYRTVVVSVVYSRRDVRRVIAYSLQRLGRYFLS